MRRAFLLEQRSSKQDQCKKEHLHSWLTCSCFSLLSKQYQNSYMLFHLTCALKCKKKVSKGLVNGSEATSSHFISKVTVFWGPAFQMENVKPSSFNALNALLNWAAVEVEHGEGTLRKALQRSCCGELVKAFCLYQQMKIRTPQFFRSRVKISVLGALFSMEKQSDALIILFVQLITGIASVFTS